MPIWVGIAGADVEAVNGRGGLREYEVQEAAARGVALEGVGDTGGVVGARRVSLLQRLVKGHARGDAEKLRAIAGAVVLDLFAVLLKLRGHAVGHVGHSAGV